MSTTLKYSRQREAIKDYLTSTDKHPTADTVYMNVREDFPNISLGTVYRNLNLLAELGDAIKISTGIGGDRFDGQVKPHYHFCCTHCGSVLDLHMEEIDLVNESARKVFDGIIDNHSTIFYGTCKSCLHEKKS